MNRSIPIVTALVVLALGACGGDDESGDAVTTTASTTSDTTGAPTSSVTPAPTEAPATADTPDTSDITTTAPTSDATPISDAPAGDAECLNGTWRADAAEFQRRVDELGFPMTFAMGPETYSEVTLAEGRLSATARTTITAELPGAGLVLTADGTNTMDGTYTTAGNVVTADVAIDSSDLTWSASVGGTEIPLPAGTELAEPPSSGVDFNGSTFACTDTSLTFDVIGSQYGTITYTRVG